MNCDNWGATKRFQLADFYLFTKLIASSEYCPPEGDFEGAMNGDTAYAECPNFYEGTRSRYCYNNKLQEEVVACYPAKPQYIDYGATTLELMQNKEVNIVPTILGVEVTVTAFPTLPAGLTLVPSTGAITGKPTTVQDSRKYTISVTNEGGMITTTISIMVLEAPVNYVLIVLIVVVVIVAIVVLIVMLGKKKKSGTKKRLPKSAKSAKAPVPKPAQIRTKTVTSFHAPDSKPTFITTSEPAPRTYTEPAPRTYNEPTAKSAPIIIEVNVEPSMRI